MGNSRTITIKNPSRKLEEKIREAGVQKYLWLKELCSEETKPNAHRTPCEPEVWLPSNVVGS